MQRVMERVRQGPALERRVEQQVWLDRVGDAVQRVFNANLRRLGPRERPVRDVLHGTWLGHPLHPVLTDVPVGAWTAALLLDAAGARRGADVAVGAGIVGAAAAAPAGVADWSYTRGGTRRLGVAHALLNTVALGLYSLSLVRRLQGRRGSGVAFSLAGYAVVLASAYLGGELVYRLGTQVNRNAWTAGPGGFMPAVRESELTEGRPVVAQVNGVDVMLVRRGGRIYALENTCAHQGGPLAEGTLEDGKVVCPWHGSTYRLEDGGVVHGPSPFDQPRYETRVVDGMVEVREVPSA
ncbi:MAG TPA: Rieske 2Fe-2S domain-containing protein [Dehalococcoidia bacterium]